MQEALKALQAHTAEGHGKGASSAAQQLRAALKQHGKLIDQDLESQVNTALIAAGELEGWQRWSATRCARSCWPRPRLARPPRRPGAGRPQAARGAAPAARGLEEGRPKRPHQPCAVEEV
ncbi:hypothetical protein [Comamonas sp. JC664]|uniref:hypothetical protein n=1 Tax=Comamonas sp. JC664 TaxID=2801917 RepID=UPI0036239179